MTESFKKYGVYEIFQLEWFKTKKPKHKVKIRKVRERSRRPIAKPAFTEAIDLWVPYVPIMKVSWWAHTWPGPAFLSTKVGVARVEWPFERCNTLQHGMNGALNTKNAALNRGTPNHCNSKFSIT